MMTRTRADVVMLGPPGCGKTTALLRQVAIEMDRGTPPQRIAYVSFTRKAAGEAITRAVEQFKGDPKKDYPYFRTLHSLAFRQLGLTRDQMLGVADYQKLGEALGLSFSGYMLPEGGLPVSARCGDQANYIVGLARATMRTLEQQVSRHRGQIDYWMVKRFADTLDHYKLDTGLVDFSDLLDMAYDQLPPLDIDAAFIDEAQDLSKQQWRVIDHLFQRAQVVYAAGDDDQAIFRWAGASVKSFQQLDGRQIVLDQSYRLPRKIHQVCLEIANRINGRIPKLWQAKPEPGEVIYCSAPERVAWPDDTVMVLARNDHLLDPYEEVLKHEAIPYSHGRNSNVNRDAVTAIIDWEKLRKGLSVAAGAVKRIYAYMWMRDGYMRGATKLLDNIDPERQLEMVDLHKDFGLIKSGDVPWQEALTKIADVDRQFFLAARRRGERLTREPRVLLSTIHGAKGGEADHVVLLSDMAPRSFESLIAGHNDEHRVAYVGASRARQSLIIMQPTTPRSYRFP
jgi:DNA helicase II / ATP-dependent DNA helicase PcrA